MIETMKGISKSIGIDTRLVYQNLSAMSLKAAIVEQDLGLATEQCRSIIPDISDQYTGGFDPVEFKRYWEIKLRGLHAFQMKTMLEAVAYLGKDALTIVDIGDSSGNHGRYLTAAVQPGKIKRFISVNLDPVAVEKVKRRGGEAILSRAEELDLGSENIDLYMSFEMVEHLTDPARFMYNLAKSGRCDYFLMTVPLVRQSRVGLNELRGNAPLTDKISAEALHIFELSPDDWILLARFAGWKPVWTRTYRQYPLHSPMRVTAPLWRRLDYEGFFGVLMKRDLSIANRYQDW